VTGAGPGAPDAAALVAPAVVTLCHEYAALAGAAVAGLAEFLADAAALAVRSLPSAQSARIRADCALGSDRTASAAASARNSASPATAAPASAAYSWHSVTTAGATRAAASGAPGPAPVT